MINADVFIWHANLLPSRFSFAGHVMVAHHCVPKAYLSQYPHEPGQDSSSEGPNVYWTYDETLRGAKSPPVAIFTVEMPDAAGFLNAVPDQRRIPFWGAILGVNSRSHTHCARAASEALKAGGLPINSAFNQMDNGGQIFPRTLHKILSHMAGVDARNQRGFSGEPHKWSVRLRQGCLVPVVPLTPVSGRKS